MTNNELYSGLWSVLKLQIEPYILLPIAASFVLIVIVFIRAVAGPRNVIISKENCSELLSFEEPENKIERLLLSLDNAAALMLTSNENPLRLVRRHGDKVVLQTLNSSDIEPVTDQSDLISIHRQDFSHPAIKISCTVDEASTWVAILDDLSSLQLSKA